MPLHASQNLYVGINPHLNSFLQNETGWKGFHTLHLTDIARFLEQQLPQNYYTVNEESLQIGVYDEQTDIPLAAARSTIPDIAIYRSGDSLNSASSFLQATLPTMILPLEEQEIAEKEVFLTSVVIYRVQDNQLPGHPVTRIELLSPSNKYPGAYHPKYLIKREQTLSAQIRLIEIDYLHQQRPIIARLPSYPDHEQGAFPYIVLVSDPRPTVQSGKMEVYGFGVVEPLPIIKVPLDNEDTVLLDLGEAYQQTFMNSGLFKRLVDYTQLPLEITKYWEVDQQQIRDYMKKLQLSWH